jgi:Uma2 family endonuclease
MPTLKKVRPISVEEYLEGEKYSDVKHEFVSGEVHGMVGASRAHNRIAGAFYAALLAHLRGPSCSVFMADIKLRIGDDFYYPDVLVTCDKTDVDPYFVTRPSVVVEVLSPGTVVRDTREKLVAYQGIDSLREYVLAEQERREVRVFRRAGPTWDIATYAGTGAVELSAIDLSVPLDEIYRNVLR